MRASASMAAAIVAALGCRGVRPADKPAKTAIERVDLGPDHRGLSGLTRAGDRLWAVPERTRHLLSFAVDGSGQTSVPIEGLGEGFDLESLAHLGGDRFAVGTEGRDDGRPGDDVVILEIVGGAARVADRLPIGYSRLGLEARGNQGIEGLCADGGIWLAAIETPVVTASGRAAPLARIDERARSWRPLMLRLSSETGKISALDCRRRGDKLEVLAIERHFEVVRILRFEVADSVGEGAVLEPVIAADLADVRRPSDNPEGIVWQSRDTALVILDNHYGSTAGVTELLRVRLARH